MIAPARAAQISAPAARSPRPADIAACYDAPRKVETQETPHEATLLLASYPATDQKCVKPPYNHHQIYVQIVE